MYINTLYVYKIVLSVSYYSILFVQLMLQGNEAEGADTLFDGKGTKNNRDFQISRKIFQSGLENFCLAIHPQHPIPWQFPATF